MLKSIPSPPAAYCDPWDRWHLGDYVPRTCCLCQRAIAAPAAVADRDCACFYCGLAANGELPLVEIEPGEPGAPWVRQRDGSLLPTPD